MERSLDYSPHSAAGALLPFCRRESNTMDGGDLEKVGRIQLRGGVPGKPEDRSIPGKNGNH